MNTHYEALEVPEQASAADIRRAYRRLVLLTHPDRTQDPIAHERYLAVNRAYDVLSVPNKRQFYDAQLWALRNPPPRPTPAPLHPDPAFRKPGQPGYVAPRPYVPRSAQPLHIRYATEFRQLLPYVRGVGFTGLALALLLLFDLSFTRTYPNEVVNELEYIWSVGRRGGESYFRVYTRHATFRIDNTTDLAGGDRIDVHRSWVFRQVRRVHVRSGKLTGSELQPPGVFNSYPLLIGLLALFSAAVHWPRLRPDRQFNIASVSVFVLLFTLLMLAVY